MEISLPIKNYDKQQQIFDHTAKFKIVVKGRRAGLTKGAANDFIKAAVEKKFKQGLWVDTINGNIERYLERYFIPALRELPKEHWNWRKQAKILEIFDSYIDFRSADRPESIEGFGYDKVFLNEAGIILKKEYLWQNAIRPMLWDFKPNVVIGGTPKGKGVFFELAARGQNDYEKDYKYFHLTPFDNPYVTHDMIKEDMEHMDQRAVDQEVYGKFIDDTGVVFRGIERIATARPQKPIRDRTYICGVDLAKHQDYTVISVFDQKTNDQVYQFRFRELDWPLQKKRIREVAKHFNNARVALDATGLGDPVADDLAAEGVLVEPIKITAPMKKDLIEKLVIWNEQQKYRILNIKESIAEYRDFTYDVTSSGRYIYGAPEGMHDDIVISHALAVHLLYEVKKDQKPKRVSRIKRERLRQAYALQQQEEGQSYEYY